MRVKELVLHINTSEILVLLFNILYETGSCYVCVANFKKDIIKKYQIRTLYQKISR